MTSLASRVVAVLVVSAGARSAQSVIDVPGDFATIQAAITSAQDGDTVRVAPGTYLERINFRGKALTVESSGGAAVTTLDGAGAGSVVRFGTTLNSLEGRDSILRGFTLTNGAAFFGGGIDCGVGTSPTIQQCIVHSCAAALSAGGVFGDPLLEDCVIRDNRADDVGGGLQGAPTLVRCVVQDNRAQNGAGGLACRTGTHPLLSACTLRGNRVVDPLGATGGVSGDARLEDCLVELNQDGALSGSLELVRCTVRSNTGAEFAALALTGGSVEDSVIVGNGAAGGSAIVIQGDGVELRGCVIAGNSSAGPCSFGPCPIVGTAVYSSARGSARARLLNCTIVDNLVVNPQPGDVGGIYGSFELVNTILRGNTQAQYAPGFTLIARYCDVEGGLAGTGNFDADPLFVGSGDYHLSAGSPCIDAGEPGPLDPDCTPSDVGALYFAQPLVTVRNGLGTNPLALASLVEPRLGTTWRVRVNSALVPGTTSVFLIGRTTPLSPGVVLAAGEVLVGGPRIFQLARASTGTQDDFDLPLPNDPALFCLVSHVQALLVTGGGARLTNALAAQVGR